MTTEKAMITIRRDCYAFLIPSGARMLLRQGTEVTITQDLGNSFTVNVYGNLARIEGKDADVLGKALVDPLAHLSVDLPVEDQVWAQLKTVYDPEIPVNIVDLGLVYQCDIQKTPSDYYQVSIVMTLTAPGCGMGPVIAEDAKQKVQQLPLVESAYVEIVFDPPWSREMMSDAAKLELGMF